MTHHKSPHPKRALVKSRRTFLRELGVVSAGALGCATPGLSVQPGQGEAHIPMSELVQGERAAMSYEEPSWFSFEGNTTFYGLFAHLMGERIGDDEINFAQLSLQSNLARLPQIVEVEVSLIPYAYTFKAEYVLGPQERRVIGISPTFDLDRINELKTAKRVQGRIVIRNGLERDKLGGEQVITESLTIEPVTRMRWAVHNEEDGSLVDLRPFVVMLVTPDDRDGAIAKLIREASNYLPSGVFKGYDVQDPKDVALQIEALYKALQARQFRYNNLDMQYFDSTQRVRLPRESLAQNQGNCVDTSLVFASALEALGLEPALIFMSKHMFLGVRDAPQSKAHYFIETTLINTSDFATSMQFASKTFDTVSKTDDNYLYCHVREFRQGGFLPVDA